MQALINFLARFLNSAKDAFNVQVSRSIPAEHTFGWVHGYDTGTIDGDTDDWYAVRSADDAAATDVLNTLPNVLKYFKTDGGTVFNQVPIWIKIPIMEAESGWRTFAASIINNLGVSLTIDAYIVPQKDAMENSTLGSTYNLYQAFQIVTASVIANNGNLQFGPGGVTFTNCCQWPLGYLVIKATPADTPAATNKWRLYVARAK